MAQPFRIAIVGGGIGGLFAALAIHHHCKSENIHIDVYEQAPQYSEIGAGVGIGPNATKLIEKIGLIEETKKIAGKRGGIWFSFRRYDTGEEVLMVPSPETVKTPQLPMHRAEFLDVLVKAIQDRRAATLHTQKRCQRLEDMGETMSITFTDGSKASANLVIGADGIHSVVRSHYVSDHPQYGGMVVYRGLCPISELQGANWPLQTYSTIWMAPGKHFLTFPISGNETLNVVGFVSTAWENLGDVRESWTLAADRSQVQEAFKEFAKPVQTIMEKMNSNPLKWILFDREPLDQWQFSGGKVVLLGDACHAMCPHQGAGAGQAMEDGYIIGRTLRDYFQSLRSPNPLNIQDCLQVYQSVRLPRAQKVQVTSRQAGALYEMEVDEVAGLTYDDGLPIAKTMLENRMKWIWSDDIDHDFEQTRKQKFAQRL